MTSEPQKLSMSATEPMDLSFDDTYVSSAASEGVIAERRRAVDTLRGSAVNIPSTLSVLAGNHPSGMPILFPHLQLRGGKANREQGRTKVGVTPSDLAE